MSAGGGGAGGGNCRAAPGVALEWKFSQVFGERAPGEEVHDVDVISAIEFEEKGNYLATGDHGGRIVLFERSEKKKHYSRKESENCDYPDALHLKYMYKTEFQSHEPEFDYLKSLEIEEKINKLRWCAAPNSSLLILSANNRTIKLWKVLDQKVKKVKEMVLDAHVRSENGLLADMSFMIGHNTSSIPNGHYLEWGSKTPNHMSSSPEGHQSVGNGSHWSEISTIEDATSARCRKIYAHAHDYNINSLSNNSDGETFISADDLRINLWNLEVSNQCFNIIDMKPPDMEDLVEVITSAEFHPVYCNILAYSSSRGFIRLVDMRQSALCDKNARILQDHEAHGSRSFFTEIIASISDIKFARDGVHILSRDFMTLKLWDLRMDVSPIATYKVHEYLRPKLHELYNNDSIFDKFGCCLSSDGLHFATGSYSNMFRVFSRNTGNDDGASLEASRNPNRILNSQPALKATRLLHSFTRSHTRRGYDSPSSDISHGLPCDLSSKLNHLAWHPTANLIACAAVNSLYLYYA